MGRENIKGESEVKEVKDNERSGKMSRKIEGKERLRRRRIMKGDEDVRWAEKKECKKR